MPFCSSCGAQAGDEQRFCSHCGTAILVPQDRDEDETRHQALGPNDVPRWLGPLGFLLGPTLLGLPIYSYWAYRRGRRDGIERAPVEPPYTNFWWQIAGWVGAIFIIPPIGLYVWVHLPTLCYKQGLRVGAQTKTAGDAFTSVPALSAVAVPLALLTVAIYAGVALSYQEEGDQEVTTDAPVRSRPPAEADLPVSTGPLLTGAEAAGKAEAEIRRQLSERGGTGISIFCEAEDFNQNTGNWIVLCLGTGPGGATSFRLTVHDRLGTVGIVQ
jgi:hypothetical protein